MIPEQKTSELDSFADLMQRGHVYVVHGFRKTLNPSIYSPVVTDILARYVPRQKIVGFIDLYGKPRVQPVDGKTLFISLSHVKDILLIALAADFDVGVDVEVIRQRRYLPQIAERYFDNEPKNIHDFYHAWTAREAFIKAIGSRMSLSLAHIQTKEFKAHNLQIGSSSEYTHEVSFFSPCDNCVAALCRKKEAQRDYVIIPYVSSDVDEAAS